MAEHTPIPWNTVRENLRGGVYFIIRRPGMEDIDIHEGENGDADSAFIVRAVNSFDILVEALKTVAAQHALFVGPDDPIANATKEVVRTALAKAEAAQ